ncbi:MAG: nicotinate (nicotinamide) nucleotide adenylyltransferase [Oscillospiraceae bacterium]|nr:nicotinate (nicotinamide) nucleotide adenylyltransferase [Oscillospiraceae bacterium]
MSTGIFGGTFNPPHLGHERLVRRFADRLSLSKTLVIPTYEPPHKFAGKLAPAADRLRMCQFMFGQDSRFEISAMEIEREGKSYTVDTLTRLRETYPGERLYLIIGSDMLESFHRWYRAEDILAMCTLCAARREIRGESGDREQESGVIFDDMKPFEISSTEIRELAAKGEDVRKWTGDAVADYIRQRGLYLE